MLSYLSRELTLDVFKVPEVLDDEWVVTPASWEARWEAEFGGDLALARKVLLNSMRHQGFSEQKKNWLKWRWTQCLFDSVTRQFFALGSQLAPTAVDVEGVIKREDDPSGVYNGGRTDLSYSDVASLKWGAQGSFVAIREKLDGARVVRLSSDPSYISLLGHRIFVGKSFPYDALEWTEKGLFILYPFGAPSSVKDGAYFQEHPWLPPLFDVVQKFQEGAMLLSKDGKEYRVKRVPTIDCDLQTARNNKLYSGHFNGIWEVSWNYQTAQMRAIRPRPGKMAAHLNMIRVRPCLADVTFPLNPHQVMINQEGKYCGALSFRADVLILDSGWRRTAVGGYGDTLKIAHVDHSPVPLPNWAAKVDVLTYDTTSMYNYVDATTGSVFLSPYPAGDRCTRVCGSKVLLVSESGEFLGIREKKEQKPDMLLDCVGGKIEVGETAHDAMIREFYEETDLEMPPAHFLGLSSALSSTSTKIVEYHSFMWVCAVPASYTFPGVTRFRHIPQGSVDWLPRLVSYCLQQTNSSDSFSLYNWIIRREAVQKSLIRQHGTGQKKLVFDFCGRHTLMVEEDLALGDLAIKIQEILKVPPVRLELPNGSVGLDVGHHHPDTDVLINFATTVSQVYHGDRPVVFSIWDRLSDSFVSSDLFVGESPGIVANPTSPLLEMDQRRPNRKKKEVGFT